MTFLAAINQNGRLIRPNPPPVPDALQIVLAPLADLTWSGNVSGNTRVDTIERRVTDADFASYYSVPGHGTITPPASQNPNSYGSGVYYKKKYWSTGGGHNDWCGSEVAALDMGTLLWGRTDESAKIAEDGTNAPDVPFQTGGTTPQKAWRNPSGRHAPMSGHMYGGMDIMTHNEKIYTHAGAPYPSGTGNIGGSTWIDVATGHWDEGGAYAGAPGSWTDVISLYLPVVKVVGNYSTFTPTGVEHHGILRIVENKDAYLINPDTKQQVGGIRYFSAFGAVSCHGCLITDPLDGRYMAYVAHANTNQYLIMHRVNATTGPGTTTSSDTAYGSYAAPMPAGVGPGIWIDMEKYIPGCAKIAVFSHTNGLYALNKADFSLSSQIIGSPTTWGDGQPLNKRFFFMPEYDCFGMINNDASAFYVLKRPSVFS